MLPVQREAVVEPGRMEAQVERVEEPVGPEAAARSEGRGELEEQHMQVDWLDLVQAQYNRFLTQQEMSLPRAGPVVLGVMRVQAELVAMVVL